MPKARAAAGFVLVRPTDTSFELLALRNAKHGSWGMPKGTVDPGETVEQAAWRELEEEVALTRDDLALADGFLHVESYMVPVDTWGPGRPAEPTPKSATYWLAQLRPTGRQPVRSAEHDRMEWVPRSAVAEWFAESPGMPDLTAAAIAWIDQHHEWLDR